MVHIKSSVLVAAAALSATASALPAANGNAIPSGTATGADMNLNLNLGQSLPTAATGSSASPSATPSALLDANVHLSKLQGLINARDGRKHHAAPLKGKGKGNEKDGKSHSAKGHHEAGGKRSWRGILGKRGPWRTGPEVAGGDLLDVNIGSSSRPVNNVVPASTVGNVVGNLIDISVRSPHHADYREDRHDEHYSHDRVILTGDGDSYYRNAEGHVHEHIHSRRRHDLHTVMEVIGEGHRHHDYEVIDDDAHGHTHVHGDDGYERIAYKRHHGDVEIIEGGRHGHHADHIVEMVDGRHGFGYAEGDEHIHAHSHKRHYGHDVEIIEDGRHHHHGGHMVEVVEPESSHVHEHVHEGKRHEGDVTVVNGHRHDDVTVVNNGEHRQDSPMTVVNNEGHRHHGSATTVVNQRDGSPRPGPAFLKRSHDDRHGATIIDDGRHADTTVVSGDRHLDTTVVNGDHHAGTTIVNGGRHTDTTIVNGDRHSNTIINSGHHSDTTVVNGGRHDTTIVNNLDGHHHSEKRHSSERIVVVGDSRHYRDADFYYRNSWDRGLKYGRPIYFTNGDNFNRVRVVQSGSPYEYEYEPEYSYGYGYQKRSHAGDHEDRHDEKKHEGGKRHWRGDDHGDVTVVNQNHRHGDVTVVNNDNTDGHHHDHHNGNGGDVTVVNNHKRSHDDRHDEHHGHRDHRYHDDEECRHGQCDARGDVTVVNNKRQLAGPTIGGAPGYIDVTSPVFNSTTAERIASLVLSTSNGTDPNSAFVLNASNNIRTQVYLVPVNGTAPADSANGTSPIQVNLKLPIFVASTASVEPYCATFDPSPDAPAPLSVMPCMNDTSAHESQQFLYNPATGVIHPDWQPSAEAQDLLQAVPDSVDDDSFADATMTASSTIDAQAFETGYQTMSSTLMPTGYPTAFATAAAAAAGPTSTGSAYMSSSSAVVSASTSASASASALVSASSSTSGSSSATPPLVTSGPSTSTASTPLNQTSTPSNVTLIFTPATPAIVNSETSFDSQPDANEASMSQDLPPSAGAGGLSRRSSSSLHVPDFDNGNQQFNRDAYSGELPSGTPYPVVPTSAAATTSDSVKDAQPNSVPLVQAPMGDSIPSQRLGNAQKPMSAPSLTAPYERR